MSAMSPSKAAVALGIAGAAYVTFVRPWYQYWGATAEEIARAMPLDDRIPEPTVITTRAVTVQARLWSHGRISGRYATSIDEA